MRKVEKGMVVDTVKNECLKLKLLLSATRMGTENYPLLLTGTLLDKF